MLARILRSCAVCSSADLMTFARRWARDAAGRRRCTCPELRFPGPGTTALAEPCEARSLRRAKGSNGAAYGDATLRRRRAGTAGASPSPNGGEAAPRPRSPLEWWLGDIVMGLVAVPTELLPEGPVVVVGAVAGRCHVFLDAGVAGAPVAAAAGGSGDDGGLC